MGGDALELESGVGGGQDLLSTSYYDFFPPTANSLDLNLDIDISSSEDEDVVYEVDDAEMEQQLYEELAIEADMQQRYYFREGNETKFIVNCSSAFDNVQLSDPRVFGSLVPLGLICLIVIFGNMMVIAAVRMTRKLRGATNLFIVSLAWADLMLGMVVLPFSAMYEVFAIWVFGDIWCSIWLAVDVWTCTASILHLVVISMDRYIAVTHPITYPNIMTSKRAKLLILGCWCTSFIICFPPLVGWNERDEPGGGISAVTRINATFLSEQSPRDYNDLLTSAVRVTTSSPPVAIASEMDTATAEIFQRCMPQCRLIQEPGYVIYSAVGSFFAPMLVMMFFNWRIYRTARKTTKAIRQGWTKVKGAGGEEGGLGIHRGGGAAAAAAAAMAMSAGASMHNRASSRKASASLRVNNSVTAPSSRRQSTVLAHGHNHHPGNSSSGQGTNSAVNLRRQQTMTAGDVSSRTLPRSTGNGRIKNSATCNGIASKAASNGTHSSSNLLSASNDGGSLKSKQQRKLSASTNSLHVPDFHDMKRGRSSETLCSNASPSPPHNTFRRKSLVATTSKDIIVSSPAVNTIVSNGNGKGRMMISNGPNHCANHINNKVNNSVSSTNKLANGRPKLSQHQPCPNHIMGKTFAEMGTQTQKAEKKSPVTAAASDAKPAKRRPFRWRARKSNAEDVEANNKDARPASPCSLDEGRSTSKPRCGSCFRFRRWRHGVRSRQKAANAMTTINLHHEDDSPPHSADDLLTAAAAANKLNSSHAGSSATVNSLGANAAVAAAATKFGKRNIKSQVRRFRMETKAAKTLGIIVGCFICCWFPFFTSYLITAFCVECIPALAFSIIFWLGYCNSAINPFIYAMFSREFRNAFKKILCKFLCNRNPRPEGVGALARMGLPFAPQTVAIGLADRFPAAAFPLPVATTSAGANDNLSTTSSNRTSMIRTNSQRP